MLKNLLFGRVVNFVALDGYVLTVRSAQPLKHAQLKLRVRLGAREVVTRFRPTTAREVPGGYLYTGLVTEGLAQLEPGLRALEPEEEGFLRSGERVPYSTRVLSRDLPGFRAVTLDFSPGGLQMEAEGPIEVGSVIQVTLDQGYDTPGLSVKGRVAWCAGCRVGLEFFFLEKGQRAALARIYDRLTQGRDLSVSQRLAHVHRQAMDLHDGPARPVSCPCEGEVLSYAQSRGALVVDLGHRELLFGGLSSVNDRQGSAGTDLARLEFSRIPAGWAYRLLSPRGGVVLEIQCETCPDELLGPSLQVRRPATAP